MQISKLDAAKRQIETATQLYFMQRDPVSVHTLVAAAYQLVSDLDAHQGGEGTILEKGIQRFVKPDYQQTFRSRIREPQNFFKHADHDPEHNLRFDALETDLLLLAASFKYFELSGEILPISHLFQCWLTLRRPDWFNLDSTAEAAYSRVRPQYGPNDRARFFHEMFSHFVGPAQEG